MSFTVDDTSKTIYADMRLANKKDIAKINDLVKKGYHVEQTIDEMGGAKPMPHNMGIHMDSSLVHF